MFPSKEQSLTIMIRVKYVLVFEPHANACFANVELSESQTHECLAEDPGSLLKVWIWRGRRTKFCCDSPSLVVYGFRPRRVTIGAPDNELVDRCLVGGWQRNLQFLQELSDILMLDRLDIDDVGMMSVVARLQ